MMTRYFYLSLLLGISYIAQGQELTGNQLLEKAIAYHDPDNLWASFNGELNITMSTPDGNKRISNVQINLPAEYFQVHSLKDSTKLTQTIQKGICHLKLNGSSVITDDAKEKYSLSCERAEMYKNYYTYLYGLPMKLKDPGTIIDTKTQRKSFKGKEYVVLKAIYEKDVGGDIWYFYFDPNTYALEVYQFFRDESKPDGEYILLSGEEVISGIKMPKTRAWYYNFDDKYLGTDELSLKN